MWIQRTAGSMVVLTVGWVLAGCGGSEVGQLDNATVTDGAASWTQKASTYVPGHRPAPQQVNSDCDEAAIARDLGQTLNVRRCHGDWAYVDSGELGDAQSLLRRVDGTWTRYTGFPSSLCKDEAAADGVPHEELTSFRPCPVR